MEATGILTQEAVLGDVTLVDAYDGFNKLIRLPMLWVVQHHWMVGVRFTFNFFKNWVNLLLRRLVRSPVTFLSQRG